MTVSLRRVAAAILLASALLAVGCAPLEAEPAVPTAELAVELAKEDVEGYVRLLMTVLKQDVLDTSGLSPVVSESVLQYAVNLREQRIELRESVSGELLVHSQTLESVENIGSSWRVVMLACLDYTQILRHREDGSTLPAAPGTTLPQRRIEVRIDANTGSREVFSFEDTGQRC